MGARNTFNSYGWVARAFHWLVALGVIGMFALGLWMRGLDYYDPWYQPAPDLHISIGFVLLGFMVCRLLWKSINPKPVHIGTNAIENTLASMAHFGLYALLLALMISGYLYATAEGRPTDIFGVVQIPALPGVKSLKGTIGWVHEYLAYAVIGLASLHALAALKHHFVDKDETLSRMVRGTDETSI